MVFVDVTVTAAAVPASPVKSTVKGTKLPEFVTKIHLSIS